MDKVYKKEGNSKPKGKHKYCKVHFIKKYGREPNILDTAHFGIRHGEHCERRNVLNTICNGVLILTDKYREDNESVEEYICQTCNEITTRR